jgi:DNA-binding CsgD family transcriptional regulator
LLTPAEQQLFRQLAVLVGGCSLAAAEAVSADAATDTRQSIVDGLTALAHQSLLAQETGISGETRYTMLETVREFGLERLSASEDETAVRERHARWLIELSAHARTHWVMADYAHWLDRQELERGNLRAALSWTIERGNAELSYALAIESNRFWRARGPVGEGIAWLEAVLELPAPSLWERTEVLELITDLSALLGDIDRAIARAGECVQLARSLSDPIRLNMALNAHGRARLMGNQPEETVPILEEAIDLARANDLRAHLATDLSILGVALRMLGDLPRAIALLEEGLEISNAENFAYSIAGVTEKLGDAVRKSGDLARADVLYRHGLRLGLEHNEQRFVAVGLAGLAILSAMKGRPERAAHLCGLIDAVMQRVGTALTPGGRENYEAASRQARGALGAERFDLLWQEGRSIPPAEFLSAQLPASSKSTASEIGLTRRELDVLRLLADGRSNREIADALFISPRTVTNHVASIISRLGVHSRAAAASYAVRSGLT